MQKWQQLRNTEGGNSIGALLETPGRQPEEQQRIVVKSGNNIRILPLNDLVCLEAFDDYVKVFTADDMFLKKQTMSYYEETLPAAEFIRVHRSFIIRIDQLTRIEPFEKSGHLALLKNGMKIPLSRTGYSRLREK